MTLFLISSNIIITLMFTMMKHPLSMGMILLIQTSLISMITSLLNQNSWFSYVLFLIMIGGMLILFMYMTSIASNEKFKLNPKSASIITLIPILYLLISNQLDTFSQSSEMKKFSLMPEMNMSMNKFINLPLNIPLIFMMMYLLLALIATVKITNFKQGPFRQMN